MRTVFLIFLVLGVRAYGACSAVVGATCQQGGADPVYRDTVTNLLYRDATCTSSCNCSDSVGVCAGCPYMQRYSDSYCFNQFNCATACTPVPELPASSKTFLWLFVSLLIVIAVLRDESFLKKIASNLPGK